jgi:signal transduction histidine kinase
MRRWSLRTRVTVFVTAVFFVASVLGGVLALDVLRDRLVEDTRTNAEQILSQYLDRIYGGLAATPTVDASEATSFFFLDAAGNELSESQYRESILAVLSAGSAPTFDVISSVAESPSASDTGVPIGPEFGTAEALPLDAVPTLSVDSGGTLITGGNVVRFIAAPRAVGEPVAVDRGDGVVAVVQEFEMGTGERLRVGVSSPLRPVTDGLDALRTLLWAVIPILTLAVAAITWLTATRALRPVHAITTQAREISASNLADRVPVPTSRDEVHELATTVNAMLGRLDTAHRRQQQFVADASHELRSPIAASRVQLEVALANPSPSVWTATAEAVLSEQRHLGRLVDDLLALGRLDESGIGDAAELDLDELVLDEATRPYRVPIDVAIPGAVRVIGNRQLLARAVRNLIDNAARHAATQVWVEVISTGGHATIHVDDNGLGVAPEDREVIFERFTRLDEARTRTEGGAGLGLAIVRGVARAHHGEVTCDQAPAGGARFTLTLPVPP